MAKQQRDIAAACAAVGEKAHEVPASGALDGEVAAVATTHTQRPVLGLIVAMVGGIASTIKSYSPR